MYSYSMKLLCIYCALDLVTLVFLTPGLISLLIMQILPMTGMQGMIIAFLCGDSFLCGTLKNRLCDIFSSVNLFSFLCLKPNVIIETNHSISQTACFGNTICSPRAS